MSDIDRTALAECEAVIERGLRTFYEVGTALLKIRDERLYRAEYGTFEEYCQRRWGWNRAHTNRQIRAASVLQNLDPLGSIPEIERQVRPLTNLEPEQQREAWSVAVMQSANGQPTAREVERVVRTQTQLRPPKTAAQIEAERRTRDAEKALDERYEARLRRFMMFSKLIESVKYLADFHTDSVADAWDGVWSAGGGEDFMDNSRKAQRLLVRMEREHPNATRVPGVVIQKPEKEK